MKKTAIRLMGLGFVLSLGIGSAPAIAQDSGIANTAEDFESAESSDGFFGSNTSIWDIFHNAGALSGAGVVDDGFRRSQSRQLNRAADAFREQQRARLEAQSAEADATAEAPASEVDIVE
ncbi:MAG: hypothetical protein AAFR58_21830 [Cyanobacteria bacterium J06627_28]